jgi:hypothetical protein
VCRLVTVGLEEGDRNVCGLVTVGLRTEIVKDEARICKETLVSELSV